MRSTIRTLLILVATALGAFAAGAQASSPVPECGPPDDGAPTGLLTFTFDARDGLPKGGQRRTYRLKDEVRVVVVDKNPFLYAYGLSVDEERVDDDDAIRGFLSNGLFSGFQTLLAGAGTASAEASAPVTPPPPAGGGAPGGPGINLKLGAVPSGCSGAASRSLAEWWSTLGGGRDLLQRVAKEVVDSAKGLKPIAGKVEEVGRAYAAAEPNLHDAGIECERLRAAVLPLRTRLSLLPDADALDPFEAAVTEGEANARIVAVWVARSKTTLEADRAIYGSTCFPDALDEEVKRFEEASEKLRGSVGTLRQALDRLAATRTTLAEVRDTLDGLPADAFYEVRALGPYEEATRVHLRAKRRELAKKGSKLADYGSEAVLAFGKRRFVLAVGAAWTSLHKREFGRVQGFERDLDGELVLDMEGKPKSGTVLDLTEDSSSRVTPLLILHGRVTSTWPMYLSLGLTAHADDHGANLELLVGPSVEIVPERFFLTVGAYWGKIQSLGGDQFLGAPLGEEEIPVHKNARWQIGAALSYRIPTGGGK